VIRVRVAVAAAAALLATACAQDPVRSAEDPPASNTPAANATDGVDADLVEFYTQTIDWERCGGEFDCATIAVPLDYDDPTGDTVDLAVLRSPATGDTDPLGSLVVNPGGPGASGVEYARAARAVVTDDVLERYDVVGFDPRGVGQSEPIECLGDAELDDYTAADGTPDDDAEVSQFQDAAAAFGEACEENTGELLAHVGTDDVARDLDILRSALGDQQLNYLGKSYGTMIGARYADLFPDTVGRMVLDGAMDPALTLTDIALGQAAGFEAAFEAFVGWCTAQDSCALGSSPDDARQTMADLLDRTDSDPLPTGDDDRPLTEALAFSGIALPLYYPAEQGYPMLHDALRPAIEDEDGSALLELADLYLDRTSDGDYRSNLHEAATAVNCFDRGEADLTEEQAQAGVAEFEAVAPIFGANLAWSGLACAAWPVHADAPPAPVSGTGAAPIVVVGTTGDPATPYPWAEALASQLQSGVLLTYAGFVHTAYVRAGDACIDDAVDGYLLAGEPPAEQTICQ
jgi:pimeloyl-ACP methyl ester carboxylesterase